MGLTEIEAVRATRDFNETGTLNPNVRAIVAYAADSYVPATVRSNGILLAQVAPQGGLISGTSSRSEEHTSELQSLMRISYAVFCLKKKKIQSLSCTHYK